MINVEGLSKRYAKHVAVDNISFEVGKGQIVGFLGPNGAGKTTTMRVLTCFLPPTSGKVSIAGFDVLDKPNEVKKHIGYLPETPPLYPEMTVGDYLTFVGKLKGIANAEVPSRVDEVAKRCAVADVKGKLISKLSKGYRQRVGLAQAIIHNPDVLILDEPTSGLDPKQIIETRDLIRDLGRDHTIILSTHILPEVENICQKVIIISRGKLMATDTVENLTSRLRGSEAVLVEIAPRSSESLDPAALQSRLEAVAGVSRVLPLETPDARHRFEVESLPNRSIRGDLARAVVEGGWNLTELHAVSVSLEDIFLQLTNPDAAAANAAATTLQGAQQ